MDGIISDDLFTLPLVLDSPDQSVGVGNCNSWQLEVSKDQSVPFLVFGNGDYALQNIADYPLLLPNNIENENILAEEELTIKNFDEKPLSCENKLLQSQDDIPIKREDTINSEQTILMEDFVETVVLFKCKLCSYKTTDKSALTSHLHRKHHLKNLEEFKLCPEKTVDQAVTQLRRTHEKTLDEKPFFLKGDSIKEVPEKMAFMCGKCSEVFGSFSDWRSHLSLVHNIKMHVKDVLENETLNGGPPLSLEKKPGKPEPSQIKSNEKQVVPKKEKETVCPVVGCKVRLSSREFLEKHRKCHAGPRNFTCPYCLQIFEKWHDCANHLWKSHSDNVDLYSCSNCEYKTALKLKMEFHVKIHSDEREFLCNECGKTFKQDAQLKNHQVIHLRAEDSPYLPNWSKRKECSQCKRTFCDSKSLKKHIQSVHSNIRPYVCQVCGHKAASKNRMSLHLRQHTREKPYSCPFCTFTTGDQNCLRRHAWRHSRVRPYSCQYCSYSCIQSNSLKKHLKNVHPGAAGIVSCPHCSFTSLSQKSLDSHLVKHEKNNGAENGSRFVYLDTKDEHCDGLEEAVEGGCSLDVIMKDDESQNCFETPIIDTGGITIPADESPIKEVGFSFID